jgi:hypothetical protein
MFGARLFAAAMVVIVELAAFDQIQGMQTFDNRREGTNIYQSASQDFNLRAVRRMFQKFGAHSFCMGASIFPNTLPSPFGLLAIFGKRGS